MMFTRKICAMMRIWVLFMLILPAWAGAHDICFTCHGEDGLGINSNIPIIAGAPASVQEDALYAYADGARKCVSSPMMCKIASKLTEDQIIDVAAHFAELPYKPAGEDFDPALAESGQKIHKSKCAICHGADHPGEADADIGASILHGQRKDYLRYAMQQYIAGEREQLPAMEKKIAALLPDDVEALLNYYASYRD